MRRRVSRDAKCRDISVNWRSVCEFAGFQIVWLATAIGAAQGSSIPGAVAAAVFVVLQLLAGGRRRLVVSAAAAAAIGTVLESGLALTGLVTYATPWPGPSLAPLWIMTLWLAYGTTVATTAKLLGGRSNWKVPVFGAFFGPLAYIAGAKVGALTLSDPLVWTCAVLSVAWAIVVTALVTVDGFMERRG